MTILIGGKPARVKKLLAVIAAMTSSSVLDVKIIRGGPMDIILTV